MFKKQIKIFSIALITAVFLSSCGYDSTYKSTKTSLELQSIQKKEFEATYKVVFASTLSVFQDNGYIISTADVSTGFITASSPKNSKYNFWVGAYEMKNTKSTAFIETMPSGKTSVRLNFVNNNEAASDLGGRSESSTPIENPKFYQGIFEKIQKAIFVRTNR